MVGVWDASFEGQEIDDVGVLDLHAGQEGSKEGVDEFEILGFVKAL